MLQKLMAVCLYHSRDLDGKCSAYIVRKKYKDMIDLTGIDYGDEFDIKQLSNKKVIIVDFSFSMKIMKTINKIANELIWIDHHISAIKDYEKSGLEIKGKREVGKAGCELAWEYFFPEQQIPYAFYLLGRYDVGDKTVAEA